MECFYVTEHFKIMLYYIKNSLSERQDHRCNACCPQRESYYLSYFIVKTAAFIVAHCIISNLPKASLHIQFNLPACAAVLIITHTSCIHHPFGCDHRRSICILVTVIDYSFDACLNNGFRTFIAGEKRNI